ncbi:MAG: ATP-binding cassette domain-containing protein, partial [Lachnospiraceae bacterium]|nr:ATP-binding cassette domain-containing protein [Lachnospiraceae bacterium]
MGWFENQIEERRNADQQLLEDSFIKIAGVVLGKKIAERISDQRIISKNAIDEILKYYHCKTVEVPETVKAEEQLDYCLQTSGIMKREVELTEGWYKNTYGPLLAFTKEDATPVALLPGKLTGYTFTDPKTGKQKRLNRQTAEIFDREAVCFYLPLPQKKLKIPDLLLYMKNCLTMSDIILVIAASFAVSMVGLIIPRLTRFLTGPLLSSGRTDALIAVAISLVCVSLSSQLISSTAGMLQSRLETKTSLGVQASMIMRLLSLPAGFFRNYSAGELKSRSMAVNQLCSILLGMVMGTTLSSLTSLVYIGQIFQLAPALTVPSLIIILVTIGFSFITTLVQIRINKQAMELAAKESGLSYAFISGVQKLKLAGAEKRAFAKWLDLYAEQAELKYDPPLFIKLNTVITLAITLLSNIVLYYIAVKNQMDQSAYFAFTASFGMVMGAFTGLSGTALSAAEIKPILEMAEPFLETEPETSEHKEIVERISGSIELDHVSFRYSEDTPYVLDDLSLKIRKGEYVAIVGRTGCGKSTLVRLLLGFEKPEKGTIFYDEMNLDSLNLPSLRKKIGTVTQNSGLFQGDIYSNIVFSAPQLTMP